MATHSSILAWRIPWAEESGGLQSMGSHRIRHDPSDLACTPWEELPLRQGQGSWVLSWREGRGCSIWRQEGTKAPGRPHQASVSPALPCSPWAGPVGAELDGKVGLKPRPQTALPLLRAPRIISWSPRLLQLDPAGLL